MALVSAQNFGECTAWFAHSHEHAATWRLGADVGPSGEAPTSAARNHEYVSAQCPCGRLSSQPSLKLRSSTLHTDSDLAIALGSLHVEPAPRFQTCERHLCALYPRSPGSNIYPEPPSRASSMHGTRMHDDGWLCGSKHLDAASHTSPSAVHDTQDSHFREAASNEHSLVGGLIRSWWSSPYF